MPQFVVLAIAGAGLYAGYRWLAKEMARVHLEAQRMQDEMQRRSQAAVEPRDLGRLELDQSTGVYRPRRG